MKDLLNRARHEIIQLRRNNELLSAKVEVMELFGLTLRTEPNHRERAMSQDVVYEIERQIDSLAEPTPNKE